MPNLPSLADLIASAGTSAPAFFNKDSKVGDSITGSVLDVNIRQAIDFETNTPRVWPDQNPVLQAVVTLQTELGDGKDDDGKRSVFIKWWGQQRQALLDALTAAGQSDLSVGQTFTATFSGTEKATRRGISDTKLFTYKVE